MQIQKLSPGTIIPQFGRAQKPYVTVQDELFRQALERLEKGMTRFETKPGPNGETYGLWTPDPRKVYLSRTELTNTSTIIINRMTREIIQSGTPKGIDADEAQLYLTELNTRPIQFQF